MGTAASGIEGRSTWANCGQFQPEGLQEFSPFGCRTLVPRALPWAGFFEPW